MPHVVCRRRYAISAAAAVQGEGLTSAIEGRPLAVRGWELGAGSAGSGSTTMSTLSVGGEAKDTGLGAGLRVVLRSGWWAALSERRVAAQSLAWGVITKPLPWRASSDRCAEPHY